MTHVIGGGDKGWIRQEAPEQEPRPVLPPQSPRQPTWQAWVPWFMGAVIVLLGLIVFILAQQTWPGAF